VAGVDASEQGFDQSVDDLVAEPGGHEVADRDVVAELRAPVGLGRSTGQARGAEHPAGREPVEVEGHAHQRPGQLPERAPRPHSRGRGGGVDHVGTEPGDEPDTLRAAGEHRLGADVDGEPGDLGGAQLAADLRETFQQQHVTARRGELPGGDQSGDTATHDHHVPRHAASLPDLIPWSRARS
jgi:hypothetical protein